MKTRQSLNKEDLMPAKIFPNDLWEPSVIPKSPRLLYCMTFHRYIHTTINRREDTAVNVAIHGGAFD